MKKLNSKLAEEVVYIYIDDNDTQDSVLVKLQSMNPSAGMDGLSVMLRHSDYGEHIRTGKYAINPGDRAFTVFRRLKKIDSATIADALLSEETCQHYGYDTATIAAMFVPNTYDVYWNMSVDKFLERMQKENEHFWQGEREAKAAQMQLTPIEVCTLASIIDEETSNNAEKPMIAGMYLNRLKANMPLQADPTIKFALKQFELKRIWQNLLHVDSPYNTYMNEGLPPGPIKIASIKGIDAVLNAAEHDYLYMCAKEDFSGTHNFATTYQEHLQNAARYTQALNERGIK